MTPVAHKSVLVGDSKAHRIRAPVAHKSVEVDSKAQKFLLPISL